MSNYINWKQDRFQNYLEIRARFPGKGKCGHAIKPGDVIGWHKIHGCQCSDCWARWSAENREADLVEQQSGYSETSGYSQMFEGNW